MPRVNGTTAERGYGSAHQRLRARLLPLAYDTPCPRCGLPLLEGQALDLGHTDDRSGYNGIEHLRCNRGAGARKGNVLRMLLASQESGAAPRRTPMRRARLCSVCGEAYVASYREQRTCSRACGREFRRRNWPAPTPSARNMADVRMCAECGERFTTSHGQKLTCSGECSQLRNSRRMREHYRKNDAYREATITREKARYAKSREW